MANNYNTEDVEVRLVDGGNYLVRRVQSVWSNFLGKHPYICFISRCASNINGMYTDFLGRDNVLEVAVGLM